MFTLMQILALSFDVPGDTFHATPASLWCDLIQEVFCTEIPEVGRSDNGELFNDCKRYNFFSSLLNIIAECDGLIFWQICSFKPW